MSISIINDKLKPSFSGGKDPLYRRIRQHAVKRLKLPISMNYAERLTHYKEFLRLENEMLLRYHQKGDSGLRVAHAHAMMLDVLIQYLFQHALEVYEESREFSIGNVCTLALGGYGRNELCPKSDVDIMFLYPLTLLKKGQKALQESLSENILYPLWDLGLKVGHSTRNTREAIDEAKHSIESKNAMMEARFICGSKDLFQKFQRLYNKYYLNDNPEEYLQARYDDQKKRRDHYGNTVYLQQPNIKNGVGGLRDYQNILWMAHVHHNTHSIEDLHKKGFLSKSETRDLKAAYDFLIRVRNELHFSNSRPKEVLDLESQPDIALGLGYKHKDIFERIEAFMQDYFKHATTIYQLSKAMERHMANSPALKKGRFNFIKLLRPSRNKPREVINGFLHDGQSLFQANEDVFNEDPVRLIRVFRIAQKLSAHLAPALERLIRHSLPLIDHSVIHDPKANRSLRSILQSAGNVYPTLLSMHELGVLGKFIPEFGALNCLVQHEYYHLYTADIHILRTIRELDSIFSGDNPYAEKYMQALRKTEKPGLLYLMLFLHDLGKADGIKGHAEQSVTIGKNLLSRMGVDKRYHEQILFIVEQHFEMARYTLNYDVDDPLTAASFAKQMENPNHMHYLYVHNLCDALGTSHELWNGYKDSIVTRLYQNALLQFASPSALQIQQQKELQMISDHIRSKKIAGLSKEEMDAHFSLLPEHYFLNHSEEEILTHIKLVHQLLQRISDRDSLASLEPVILWEDDDDQGLTNVHVVTWDRTGLFYKLAGAFTLAGLSILSSKIITRKDHITIDTFCLTEGDGGISINEQSKNIFKNAVRESLIENKELSEEIEQKAIDYTQSIYKKETLRLQTNIPTSIQIHPGLSANLSIIEIHTTDHLGLLYKIARCIFKHGFDISFARISTQREAALDAFHIKNIDDKEAITTEQLKELKIDLESLILKETKQLEEITA